MMKRRQFLLTSLAALAAARRAVATAGEPQAFATRGVVLYPFDLTLADWPARVARAGLNTIGLHAARRLDVLVKFVQADAGQKFLEQCNDLGVNVEYELHAMGDLLSREYFAQDETMFRMDASGQRNGDFNCCPSHPRALELIAEAAVEFGRLLRPTTHRYFYWPDDGREWCHCDKCRGLCASEQALLVEHAMLRALRDHFDAEATVCHIAYGPTLEPPKQVQPESGVFLEFAPIRRRHDLPFQEQTDLPAVDRIEMLDGNLDVFPRETAQVLEYWLDVSRLSGWKRPAVKLPWHKDVLIADLQSYWERGIRHVTSFACFLDASYVTLHGDPQSALTDYGQALRDLRS
ncbi:MAG: DUF4838 domain-containing protein [Pirellulaceae bacterium]